MFAKRQGNIKPAHGCNNWDFVQQEQTKNTGRVNYSKILAFSYTLTKSTLLDNSQTKLDLDASESGLMLGLKGHTSIAAKPVLFRVAEWPCWLNIIQLLESYETLLTAVYLTGKSVWCEHFTTKNKAPIERVYFWETGFRLDHCQVFIPGHAMWPSVLKWQVHLQMTIPNKGCTF